MNALLAASIAALALKPAPKADVSPYNPPAVELQPGEGGAKAPAPAAETSPKAAAAIDYAEFASATERRRAIVDRLRALGAPNDVLALVARVDFEVEWEPRFKECWGDMEKMAAVQLEMQLRKDAELRAALGEEGFRRWDQKHMLWEAMSTTVDVTEAEASEIYDLKKNLQARQLELEQAKVNRTMADAEIEAAHDAAFWDFFGRLKAVLGEERFAVSQQLDAAFAADNLRHQLSKVNVSESQFQQLFRAEQAWNHSQAELNRQYKDSTTSPEYLRKLQAVGAAREQEYERILGTAGYHELKKKQDPGYAQMKKYERRWGLDDQKIDYVYGTMKDYEKVVEGYRNQVVAQEAEGKNVDWEEVSRTLQQHAEDAQNALRARLGDDSFTRLQRNRILRFMGLRKGP